MDKKDEKALEEKSKLYTHANHPYSYPNIREPMKYR